MRKFKVSKIERIDGYVAGALVNGGINKDLNYRTDLIDSKGNWTCSYHASYFEAEIAGLRYVLWNR